MRLPFNPLLLLALMSECFLIYASVLVKVIEMPPINIAFYRIIIALPFFLVIANASKNVFRFPIKDMFLMIFAGVFFSLDLLFFNMSLRNTSVANVNLMGSLACFILVPIGIIFFKESVKKSFFVGAVVAAFGVFTLVNGRGSESVASFYGDFLAFLSVVCYAFFLSIVYGLRKKYNTMEIMFFACIGSSISLYIFAYIIEGVVLPNGFKEWLVVCGISFFGQIVGQGLFNYVLGKVNIQTSSLLLLFSPVIAAIMGFFILGEKLGIFEILGIFIIILGVYFAKRESH